MTIIRQSFKMVSAAMLVLFFVCNSNAQAKKPNILFILVDDLGYADLSVMGSNYYETPNIDHIAKSGVIFTNGYAASAVCGPSRASLLLGQFTARHGMTQYDGAKSGEAWKNLNRYTKLLPPEFKHHLDSEAVTLPEVLKENGYTTFFAGKWHLGGENDHSMPTDHGFDYNIGGNETGSPAGGYFSPFKNPNLENKPEETGMSLSVKLANETAKFIMTTKKDKPFLAYLSFYAVHGPIETSQEKWSKYRDKADKMGIKDKGFEMEHFLPVRKYQDNPVYAGLIEQVDDAVGIVLKTLKELNLDKNTIIVFTSDNGGVTSGDSFSTNQLSLRGGKGYQWEGGIKVPYFIAAPWMKKNGSKVDVPVSGVDFFPTLLELAGLPLRPKSHIDGVSLVPLLKGSTIEPRSLYWHYPHYGNQGGEPNSIIRKGKWKLIYYWEDGHLELYDVTTDINERHNVVDTNKALALDLKKQLLDWLQSMNTEYATVDPLWDEDASKKRIENAKNVLLPRLENERKKMLTPGWQPNDNWWGSKK